MPSGASLLASLPVRIILMGYPGAGKTGSLAPLANAGFKLRVLDFDGNLEPLILHTRRECLDNISVIHLEDKMRRAQAGYLEPAGKPTAFTGALDAMDHWKDGETDLGHSKDWGPDTIVVMDGITGEGEAAKRWAMHLMNKNPLNTTDGVYNLAMSQQEEFVKKLTSTSNRHHTIVLSHLVMIGPKEPRKGDSEMVQKIKEEQATLLPTRLYPSALGWKLPQTIAKEFPVALLLERDVIGSRVTRSIKTIPREELDLKLPTIDPARSFDIKDGMLEVFKLLSPSSVALVQGAKE